MRLGTYLTERAIAKKVKLESPLTSRETARRKIVVRYMTEGEQMFYHGFRRVAIQPGSYATRIEAMHVGCDTQTSWGKEAQLGWFPSENRIVSLAWMAAAFALVCDAEIAYSGPVDFDWSRPLNPQLVIGTVVCELVKFESALRGLKRPLLLAPDLLAPGRGFRIQWEEAGAGDVLPDAQVSRSLKAGLLGLLCEAETYHTGFTNLSMDLCRLWWNGPDVASYYNPDGSEEHLSEAETVKRCWLWCATLSDRLGMSNQKLAEVFNCFVESVGLEPVKADGPYIYFSEMDEDDNVPLDY